jgi:hypothetical protein
MRTEEMKQRHDPSTKPYYRCLSCSKFRKVCGGLPTREMDLQNWCEYMRDVSDIFHLTNEYIAQAAEVSVTTVDRVMAVNTKQDIMRANARRIELVVLGPVGKHICELDYDASTTAERINSLLAEVEYWKKENDRKNKMIDKLLDN